MDKVTELYPAIKRIVASWWVVSDKYEVGEAYGYKEKDGVFIITIKGQYVKGVLNVPFMDKIFRNLISSLNVELITNVYDDKLPYEWGLEWLFHHYPKWPWDNTNCALVSWNRVLAVSYNWFKEWRSIEINTTVYPWYIVFNNKFKIEGNYDYYQLRTMNKEFNALLKRI